MMILRSDLDNRSLCTFVLPLSLCACMGLESVVSLLIPRLCTLIPVDLIFYIPSRSIDADNRFPASHALVGPACS